MQERLEKLEQLRSRHKELSGRKEKRKNWMREQKNINPKKTLRESQQQEKEDEFQKELPQKNKKLKQIYLNLKTEVSKDEFPFLLSGKRKEIEEEIEFAIQNKEFDKAEEISQDFFETTKNKQLLELEKQQKDKEIILSHQIPQKNKKKPIWNFDVLNRWEKKANM
jgi:hypothetical protein